MRLPEFALKRPVTTVMAFVSVVVVGLIAARMLPLEFLPDVEAPLVVVQIPYQGSTPEEVERLITRPVEEVLATLSGVKRMISDSSASQSSVVVFFDWGRDVTVKAIEARERVAAIRDELPADLQHINVLKFSTSDDPVLNLRISSDTRNLSTSYELLDTKLKRPIERLPGVSRVELYGVAPREIRIELISERVAAHDIALDALQRRLQAANFSVSAGDITAFGRRFQVKPVSTFKDIEDIENFIVNDRGLRLEDIARISYAPPERDYARHLDRRYAIGMEIFKERGANLVEVGGSVLATIDSIRDDPAMRGIQLFVMDNQADGVVSSLTELSKSGVLGAVLAFLVLYAFLRHFTTTIMVVLAVPIAMTFTLACMYFLGLSLNILTMMGLLLAVGMLVDNAVVVSESIYYQHEIDPQHPRQAALAGAGRVALAVSAGTLTSIIVFLPNLFGEKSQISIFLSHVAATICLSLTASLLIALTMIPLVASRVRPPGERKGGVMQRSRSRYGRVLQWTLRHRWITAGFIVLILVSVAVPMAWVKKDMFPPGGERRIHLFYNLHAEYPLEVVERAVNKIEDYLYAHQQEFEIRSVYSYFDENGEASSTLLLTEGEQADKTVAQIKEAVRAGLPDIAVGDPGFEWGGDMGEGMQVTLLGESSEVLRGLAAELERRLSQVDGLTDVRSEAGAGDQEVRIEVNRERALRLGFSTREVAQAIAVALRGQEITQLRTERGEVPIRLLLQDSERRTIDQLRSLTLTRGDGKQIPLDALVDVSVTEGPVSIHHENRKTALSVSYGLDDLTPPEARMEIENLMKVFPLPPGYQWDFGRSFFREQDAQSRMVFNILLAIAIIYLVLAALFESLIYPVAIMTTIVFSIIGVFWFFLITGTTFSLMAMIGILILIGVVVNNGIVLIDHVNQLRLQGMAREEAVVQGGRDRLRPILMTVATTVLGMAPLCIATTQIGGDGPPYYPMARAIVGGLLFSTVVSLLVVPSIYVFLDDLRHWSRDLMQRASGKKPVLVRERA